MEHRVITLNNFPEEIKHYAKTHELSFVDCDLVIERISDGLAPEMSSFALSRYCSEVAASMITRHPEYGKLAAVILMTYHSAATLPSFSKKILLIQEHTNSLNPRLCEMVAKHSEVYDAMIDYSRDFSFTYFGMHTLFKSYFIRLGSDPVERPQDVFMRVAIQIHEDKFDKVKETYDLLSSGYYTHGTPTMFNAMMKECQLASCFLLTPKGNTVDGIFDTVKDCALISELAGGIGLSIHDMPSAGSPILRTGDVSKGIVPIVRIFNETLKYINLTGSRRHSSIAFYIEPWHKDIFDFLDLRKNTGNEEMRARDIFTAIWMNDLFMERVRDNETWSLFDPTQAKRLSGVWGDEFRKLYLEYERTLEREVISAQVLWKAIIIAQIETGTPYMVYKDTCNRMSNQQNLGTIRSSNLCAEILEYSSPEETAVCNLASICLPKFVEKGMFNFNKLRDVAKVVCRNLNRTIDSSHYPIKEGELSNRLHRPIGIGVQGLADVFAMLRYPYESQMAKQLNELIFETIYFGAMESSVDLARELGPYDSYQGSPLSKGIFHFEMAGAKPSGLWDWEALRTRLLEFGARNSLLVALMPTATTSQINGNSECFEPFTNNIYTRRTLAGEFQVVNTYLMNDLLKLGLWEDRMRQLIIEYDGSIQSIPGIPKEIKELYKTVWEIKMKSVIDMAADRQAYVDQTQSLNLFLQQPTYQQVSSMHFYGWKKGLKTGMYYLRTKPISSPIKFTVNQEAVTRTLNKLRSIESDQENKSNSSFCESCSC